MSGRTRVRGFAPWRPQRKTRGLLAQVQTVLAEYREHLPMTVRQVFYRLVGAHGFPKTEEAYKNLCEALNRARRAEVVPWTAIRDDGVTRLDPDGWASERQYLAACRRGAETFTLARQQGQPVWLAVLVEATGMAPLVARAAHPYGVPVMASGGFEGVDFKRRLAGELGGYGAAEILHIGDYDQSGEHVFSALAQDVAAFDEACPRTGLARLQAILGPATVVVTSGGQWTDPTTGNVLDKLHLHWRLTEPTRSADDHDRLREARRLATMLAGGDPSAMPPVHPLRWPGSWNRKREPGRMARIAHLNEAVEVELGDALERLKEAVEAAGLGHRAGPRTPGAPQAPVEDVAAALAHIPNPNAHWKEWLDLGYATYGATGGSDEGLEAWAAWSAKSDKHSDDECLKQWDRFRKSPPTKIGAGTVFFHAKANGWQRRPGGAPKPLPNGGAGSLPQKPAAMPDGAGEAVGPPPPANDAGTTPPPPANDAGTTPPPNAHPDPGMADLTQDGVAWNFAGAMAGRLAYDHTAQEWFSWEEERWTKDGKAGAFHQARLYCYALRDAPGIAPDVAKDIGKIGFIGNVERAARSDPRLATAHSDWDRDIWLLGVPGGMVDLRTGELRPADPKLYIRQQTAVAPAPPGTPAPLWFKFLNEAFVRDTTDEEPEENPASSKSMVDTATIAFLQRLSGHILTGDVSEEMMTFFYGSGGNGKGVFINALTSILADYAVSVPMQVFVADARINLDYVRARMAGARLVVASEPEAGAVWSEALIKELTGNEAPISAREPYGKLFEYKARFKICMVGNHAPRLKARTRAMERRLRVVPFNNEPEKPDPDLKEKLRAEYPAILRWMLDGCVAWQRERLGTSPAIQAATEAYFIQQDSLKRWMNERCDFLPTARVKRKDLFADFTTWLRDNGDPPVTSGEFQEMISRTKGLTLVNPKNVPWVKGVAVKPPEDRGGRPRDGAKDTPEMPGTGEQWDGDCPF
jgi:putative DNA primase/helicase